MKILKDLREKTGLTLRQVEESTSISNAYLSQLENGKIKRPSAQALYVLSKLYSTNVEDLLIAAGLIKDNERGMPAYIGKSLEQRISDLEKKVDELWAKNVVFGNNQKFKITRK